VITTATHKSEVDPLIGGYREPEINPQLPLPIENHQNRPDDSNPEHVIQQRNPAWRETLISPEVNTYLEMIQADSITGEPANTENVGGMYNRVTGIGGTIKTESWYNGQRVSDELANISGQLNDQADSITGETTTAMNVGGNVSWMDPTPAEPNYMQESKVWSGYCGTVETLNNFSGSIVPQSQSFSIASHLESHFNNNQFGDHPHGFPKVEPSLA